MIEYEPRTKETTYLIKLYAKIGDSHMDLALLWHYPLEVIQDIVAGKYDHHLSKKQRGIIAAAERRNRQKNLQRAKDDERPSVRKAMMGPALVLDAEDVLYLRQAYRPLDELYDVKGLAEIIGLRTGAVRRILNQKSYRELAGVKEVNPAYKAVERGIQEGKSVKEIADSIGCSCKTTCKIMSYYGVEGRSIQDVVMEMLDAGYSKDKVADEVGIGRNYVDTLIRKARGAGVASGAV